MKVGFIGIGIMGSPTDYEKGVAISAARMVKEIYALAACHGLAEQDYSAINSFPSQGQPVDKWK
jgi:3-hydroxyisobutyrate dehydrogenase-like beta-hydroxyacid dehydrogenase